MMAEGHTEVTMTGPAFGEHSQNCRCIEFEERCKKSEARNEELELEIEKKNGEIEALKARVEELLSVKHCEERQAGGVVDLTEEWEDDATRVQLIIKDKGDVSTAMGSEGTHLKRYVRCKKGPNADTSLDDQLQTGEKSGDSEDT